MGLLGKQSNEHSVSTDTLSKQELNYLLVLLSESTFEGKDVLLLSNVVNKLNNQLEAK
jgi:hypothetical protein|tara:strand:- start:15397 stop:15570 length:174 start_codon:yes stop_codon:yes gene_type:complete